MKIAIPTAEGLLCAHFGHCQQFTVLEVDPETKSISKTELLTPPPHEPGVFPVWLGKMGCDLIIAGGMGGRAVDLFRQNGIQVIIGASSRKPEEIVNAFLNGELMTGANPCDEPTFHGDKECGNN
jgi:ATP-binding protein involved in chromosome partitioning